MGNPLFNPCGIENCDDPGVQKLKAFGNDDERWYCPDHAEIAQASIDAEGGA
jgi:hypothetical protein